MTYKIAAAILAFLVARLQAAARSDAKEATQLGRDLVTVEAARAARVKLTNDHAASITAELAAQQVERRNASTKASVLATNLALLSSVNSSNFAVTDNE